VSDEAALRPGRRFLHVCYCCAEADEITEFFVAGLNMRATMRTPMEWSDGELLGIDGQIESCASFVYDQRGPRVSPAIEVQGWGEPKVIGEPSTDPFRVGIKSLGYGVSDLAAAADRLVALGCSIVYSGPSPFAPDGITLADPTGVLIDLVRDAEVPAGEPRLRHLRITCTDLDVSLPFYDSLGFSVIDTGELTDAAFAGSGTAAAKGRYVRVRLPDEPFEIVLIQWLSPASHGRHYEVANHAGIFRIALGVDDTRASMAALEARGAVFDRHARMVELKGTPVPDMWITFISDPDGIPYEFVQRPRSAFR
jgi:catechol 2,3-dioxygenase-like lactoylglutathione lyase family enzyme